MGSVRPSSRSQSSRSSRATAYTAWCSPPWCRLWHTASPARPLPPVPLGPGAATRTGPGTGCLSMPVTPSGWSV